MLETPTTIGEWADETFGKITSPDIAGSTLFRAQKEWDEFTRSFTGSQQEIAYEMADVCIVLMRGLHAMGFADAIDKKMEINRARKWISTGDGHGRHA